MRVTQSMLSRNNLNYISQNYRNLSKIYDQVMTGKKITKPSQDPVIAMKGMRYRTQVTEIKQFQRNLNEGFNWMENADSALDETNQVLQRIRELVVQASNDSYEEGARSNIAKEITRLQEHIVALANTKVADNYIFNGTDTVNAPINENLFDIDLGSFIKAVQTNDTPPQLNVENAKNFVISYQGQTLNLNLDESNGTEFVFTLGDKIKYTGIDNNGDVEGYSALIKISVDAGDQIKISFTSLQEQKYADGAMIPVEKEISVNDMVISDVNAVSTNKQQVEMEVMKGVKIPVNITPTNVFSIDLFSGLESIKKMLTNPDTSGQEITKALDSMDKYLNDVVSTRAEIGAQVNRAEMVQFRLLEQEVVAKETLSNNEDIDLEEAIIELTIQQSVHRASLAVGAKIIQPTLMDFLR